MFVVLFEFSNNKDKASELMAAHSAWIARGIADGVFLLVGSLAPRAGGALLAHNTARSDLEARVGEDPFVASDVVSVKILEISASKTDPRLAFLLS